jgi:DNA (cytosine-5)-methyltransferase 1
MQEFFAGSGLVAYGLSGMFCPIWSNDISEKKASAYRANFADEHFVLDDIRNISGASVPYAHLSWASFPCQDLSLAGSLNGIDGARSGLVWEWLRILKEMPQRPSILLIENVAGLLTANRGENYTKLHYALSNLGYKSGAMLIDAVYFLPQSRPRVFIAAVIKDIHIPPELQDLGPNWLHNNAIEHLGRNLPDWIWWFAKTPPKRDAKLEDVIDFSLPYDKDYVLNLISPQHKKILNVLDNVVAAGYRRTRNGKQCLELRFDNIAGCLRTPEGGSSKQFLIVKRNGELHARVMSARKAARLMGAPDSFVLPEKANDAYKAMGDAVAVPAAAFVGREILIKLAEAVYGEQHRKTPERFSK